MSAVIGQWLRERMLDGGLRGVCASTLVFRLDKADTRALLRNQAVFSVYIADKEGHELVRLWSGALNEGNTMSIMDFDEAFNINIT